MTNNTHTHFSVCMSVYKNDHAVDFLTALRSISTEQTVVPDEIILVADGPISEELHNTIAVFTSEYTNLHFIQLPTNQGHAIARQTAIDAAANEWVAIMDSDDIAERQRFEKQLEYIETHPTVDVIGGQIIEFAQTPDQVMGQRIVPITDEEIKKYLKARCPMNFVTVMMRKSALSAVGGIIDWYCEEDYYLWIRMCIAGHVFANVRDNLVYVRTGNGMYQRRGGWKYFSSERDVQKYMLKHHLISIPRYLYNVFGRFIVQVAMPNKVREIVFKTFFRKQ